MPEQQAEVISKTQQQVLDSNLEQLVTNKDLTIALAPIKQELTLVKWMLGIVIAATVLPLLKGLF